ncbi:hypothetical protein C8Q80DRAFT_2601 [Daedaleopsis nitida]|nr:hypothetical protein C8Q80DRAFT_2601 [Daedaleopsis nitida]
MPPRCSEQAVPSSDACVLRGEPRFVICDTLALYALTEAARCTLADEVGRCKRSPSRSDVRTLFERIGRSPEHRILSINTTGSASHTQRRIWMPPRCSEQAVPSSDACVLPGEPRLVIGEALALYASELASRSRKAHLGRLECLQDARMQDPCGHALQHAPHPGLLPGRVRRPAVFANSNDELAPRLVRVSSSSRRTTPAVASAQEVCQGPVRLWRIELSGDEARTPCANS